MAIRYFHLKEVCHNAEAKTIANSFTGVETRSSPPAEDGCDVACCGEVDRKLVISGCDPSPIFEAAEAAFNDVSPLVCIGVEGLDVLSGWIVWYHRLCVARDEESAQGVAVIGRVGGA